MRLDRKNLRAALVELRVSFDDADAVTEDMLRPPRQRALGPALHRDNYTDAKQKILEVLDRLLAATADDDGESGNLAGATH
ncbi:Hypothetical protein A7982_07861 [Minicystis rosea]|nr:Hypothetical protein A7982_07861 [Minicystis rosea]